MSANHVKTEQHLWRNITFAWFVTFPAVKLVHSITIVRNVKVNCKSVHKEMLVWAVMFLIVCSAPVTMYVEFVQEDSNWFLLTRLLHNVLNVQELLDVPHAVSPIFVLNVSMDLLLILSLILAISAHILARLVILMEAVWLAKLPMFQLPTPIMNVILVLFLTVLNVLLVIQQFVLIVQLNIL